MGILCTAGFGSDLADNHPGFHDDVYKRRRAWISNLARQHRINSGPIPRIEYTPEEVATWAQVLSELKQLFPEHACQQYLSSFPLLNFREDQQLFSLLAGTVYVVLSLLASFAMQDGKWAWRVLVNAHGLSLFPVAC
eukprot:1152037-Pelagomonas_calceolata.AAC.1